MKITDYIILKHKNPELLETAVREYIKQGWQPQGGVAWLMDNTAIQAMVKFDDQWLFFQVREAILQAKAMTS